MNDIAKKSLNIGSLLAEIKDAIKDDKRFYDLCFRVASMEKSEVDRYIALFRMGGKRAGSYLRLLSLLKGISP